ncbi:hypothetical protein GCM10010431_82530 [Streptomyces kunmingensis]
MKRMLRGPRPESVPALAARACVWVGLLDVAAGVLPPLRHSRMHSVTERLPGTLGPVAAALTLGSGVLLLLLAHGLRHRTRPSWRAAVVLLPLGAAAQFTYRHSVVGVVVPLLFLWLLAKHRDRFDALSDPRGLRRAPANFVLMGAGSILLGLAVVSAHSGRLVGDPSLAERLEHVLYGLFGVTGPLDYTGRAAGTVSFSLGALGVLTTLTTVFLAFRPDRPAAHLTEDDETKLRALLKKHGTLDSVGSFPLRRDKGVVFSPSGKAAVCYRVVSGVMLAGGDPVGDVEAWPGAIERFMDEARAHSWTPAVMGCSETGGEVWTRETGLAPLHAAPKPGITRLSLGYAVFLSARARAEAGRRIRAAHGTIRSTAPTKQAPPAPAQAPPAPAQAMPAPAQTMPAPARAVPAPSRAVPAPVQAPTAPAQAPPDRL